MSYHIEEIPNRTYRKTILLRKAWREGNVVKKKTMGNLTHLPPHIVAGMKAVLKGAVAYDKLEDIFTIHRTLPHGHVAVLYGMVKRLGFETLLNRKRSRVRDLALAAILIRIISPVSKLGTARQLSEQTASTSLGILLGLGEVKGNEVLDMLDWLQGRKPWIEKVLATKHLQEGTMFLYDVSSSYFEGNQGTLSAFGYSRDKRGDRPQIVFGLLCASTGCPIAVEVFVGNTADPMTLENQINRIKNRFKLSKVVLVGDRGMLTTVRIEEDIKPAGLDWITALTNRQIRSLSIANPKKEAGLLFKDLLDTDRDGIGELSSDKYPGERLLVCLNPRLRADRRRKRNDLLTAVDGLLEKLSQRVASGTLHSAEAINRKIGQTILTRKVAKHYHLKVTDGMLSWQRNESRIRSEEALDGIYVIRTNVKSSDWASNDVVASYKSLALVERAFRSIKTTSLRLRPMYVYSAGHVRGHVFLCMLAYYIEWHLRGALAPLLFTDEHKEEANRSRNTPVGKAEVSDRAKKKHRTKKTEAGLPVHSFKTLLEDLASLGMHQVSMSESTKHVLTTFTEATAIQKKAFELIDVDPKKIAVP